MWVFVQKADLTCLQGSVQNQYFQFIFLDQLSICSHVESIRLRKRKLFLFLSTEVNVAPTKMSDTEKSKGITLAAARYASEDAAVLVHFVIAVVEFTRMCGPLRLAKERVEHFKKDIADYELKKQERDNEVSWFTAHCFTIDPKILS